jgi:hypothetical protein
MTARLSISAVRSSVAIAACTVVVLALSSTRIASAQGAAGTDQQLSALRQQLSALDRRVKELEKMAVNVDTGKAEASTPDARIARLEAEVRSLQSEVTAGAGSGGKQAPAQIVAPFVVVDSAGKPLMRVTEEGNGFSRGIYVYDSKTLIAGHLGVMQDGSGRVYVTREGALPKVVAAATSDGGSLALTGPAGGSKSAVKLSVGSSGGKVQVFPQEGGSEQAELKATPAGGELDVYNKQGEAVGWLEATSGGNGKFTIGRAGKIYVEAAVLQNGKGMIIAGPDVGGAPPGLVIPYYLEGRMPH